MSRFLPLPKLRYSRYAPFGKDYCCSESFIRKFFMSYESDREAFGELRTDLLHASDKGNVDCS